jgi:hypothetical protein
MEERGGSVRKRARERWLRFRDEHGFPKITPMAKLYRKQGLRPASAEEFEAVCAAEGIGPPDGEG